MNTFWNDITYKIKAGSKLYLLIAINVAVFLMINIPGVIEWLLFRTNFINVYSHDYLALPAYLPKLISRFWTPLTYMFVHAGFFHILFNMLWLYWMGQIFEEFLGKGRTLGLFILGGLAGAALYLLAYNIFPAFTQTGEVLDSDLVGASAGVMAIVVGAATVVPDYTVFLMFIGPVRLKWLALAFIVIDFLAIAGPNAGGEISHIGGALAGFIYVKQLQSGKDWIASVNNLFKKRSNMRVVANNRQKEDINTPRQEEIDRILDKISESGYDNLTKQEKEILFRASKK